MRTSRSSALIDPETRLIFGPFSVDPTLRLLYLRGERLSAGPKVVETLLVLLRAQDRYVPREEILEAVWPRGGATDDGLWRNISTLRKLLSVEFGSAAIRTLPRRGYRLVIQREESVGEGATSKPRLSNWFGGLAALLVSLLVSSLPASTFVERSVPSLSEEQSEIYALGRYHLARRTETSLIEAVREFRMLVREAPKNGTTHAGLAESLLLRGDYLNRGHNENPDFAEAERTARVAVQLCPTCAEAHASFGLVESYRLTTLSRGLEELETAIRLMPTLSDAHLWYGQALLQVDRAAQAQQQFELANRLDPTSPATNIWLASANFFAGKFERCAILSERALTLDSDSYDAMMYLAFTREASGKFDDEIRLLTRLRGTKMNKNLLTVLLARAYARAGKRLLARTLLGRVTAKARSNDSDVAVESAGVLGLLGERRLAISILTTLVHRNGYVEVFHADPRLTTLWADPTVRALDRVQERTASEQIAA